GEDRDAGNNGQSAAEKLHDVRREWEDLSEVVALRPEVSGDGGHREPEGPTTTLPPSLPRPLCQRQLRSNLVRCPRLVFESPCGCWEGPDTPADSCSVLRVKPSRTHRPPSRVRRDCRGGGSGALHCNSPPQCLHRLRAAGVSWWQCQQVSVP